MIHYRKKAWCHPQNRKYTKYRNDAGEPNRVLRQHAQRIW